MKYFSKPNSSGFTHWIIPALTLVIIGAIGSYLLTASHADTATVSGLDCQLLGRPYSAPNCGNGCVSGAGSYVTSAQIPYCSGAASPSVQGTACTNRGRRLTVGGNGCARRWQQTNAKDAIQCTDSSATYIVTSTIDYCSVPDSTQTTTTTAAPTVLPTGAPQPTALAAQPAAVGTGANPVVAAISDAVWARMSGISWNTYIGKSSSTRCPVGRSQLSYMTINYWGFDGSSHRGEMVFATNKQSAFVAAFTAIYNNKIPLHGMYLVDNFGYSTRTGGGDDYSSMQHDNTSAFNCRWVDGSSPPKPSPHAYGTAVDINPYENPYNSAQGWVPNTWWATHNYLPYTWRTSTDKVVQIMTNAGFNWTYGTNDAQHFDAR